jgi:hypothetical protein
MGTGNGGVNEIIPWHKQKTTWTAIAGVVAAIGGYFTGEVSIVVCVGSVFGALAIIFGRQGIEKSTYIPDIKGRGEELKES